MDRLLRHGALALALIVASLGLGIAGYMVFERLFFLDALLNSAMLLSGMGPVNVPTTDDGKLFASFYALYSGLVFVVTTGLLFTPVAHRLLHRFHWNEND